MACMPMLDDACDYLLALAEVDACPIEILAHQHGHSAHQAARRVGLLASAGLVMRAREAVTITGLGREGARLRRSMR